MRPSVKHLTFFTLLLVSTRRTDSVKMNMERRLADSSDPEALGSAAEFPYWEYLLREFLFKTISPSPPGNNMLYKELLEAPFYGGPFPARGTLNDGETLQVLSRGDVYHLAKGGWIICQEGCTECEICTVQKTLTVPTVKWILRRIKRHFPLSNPKRHDLQLTVLPQADNSFHMKNLSPGSYVYVTSNNGAFSSFTDTLIRQNKEIYSLRYPFGTTNSPESKFPSVISFSGRNKGKGLDQDEFVTEHQSKGPETVDEVFQTESQLETTSTLIPMTQTTTQIFPGRNQGREILRGERNQRKIDGPDAKRRRILNHQKPTEGSVPLTLFYPPTAHIAESIDTDCRQMEKDTRLILGRDQFGEKHVVHIVPAGDLRAGITRQSVHPGSQLVYQQPAHSHPVHASQSTKVEYEDRPLYRKIFRRVVDSLNTHKNTIEQFLFSQKREEALGHGKPSISPSTTLYKEETADPSNKENKMTKTSSTEKTAQSENEDGMDKDSKPVTRNRGEIIAHTKERSTTLRMLNEGNEVSTERHYGEVQVTEDQTQNLNTDFHNFNEHNSDKSLPGDVMSRGNNSETLILKEVAKSVVNHPDTLQGFNSVTHSSLQRDSDDPVLTTSEDTTSTGYLGVRERSQRHV